MSVYSLLFSLLLAIPDPVARVQTFGGLATALGGDSAWTFVVLGALAHAGYTLCSFTVLSSLSAASHAISNSMKHVVVIASGALLLGESPTTVQASGAAVAIGGVYAYNRVTAAEKASKQGPAAPTPVPPLVKAALTSWTGAIAVSVIVLVLIFATVPVLREGAYSPTAESPALT